VKEGGSGKLKLCSKSVIFEPHDYSIPLYKILLVNCPVIKEENGCLYVECKQHAQLMKGKKLIYYVDVAGILIIGE